jgi:hypothetical protein
MARATVAVLFVPVLLAAGCASRRGDPLPADPPADFRLSLTVCGVDGWPWDGRIRFDGAAGVAAYDVTFKEPKADRRGCEPLDDGAVRELWAAAAAAGIFEREPLFEGAAAGPLVVERRALGHVGRVCGDPATDTRLAALLEAARRAAPPRVLRAPPPPPK